MKRTLLALATLALLTAPAGAQNLVTNGNFNTGDFTGFSTSTGFTVQSVPVPGGTSLAAVTTGGGTLAQTLSGFTGPNYLFSALVGIDAAEGVPATVTVDFGPISGPFTIFGTGRGFSYQTLSFGFGASSNHLTLTVTGNATVAIDNISVAVNPAPEPASLVLFATGLVGIAGAARRRRA